MLHTPRHCGQRGRFRSRPRRFGLLLLLFLICGLAPLPVTGLVRFDFEQKYFVHPGRQVWDFCVVRPDSIYHIFYHTLPEAGGIATDADTIWHASSPDLMRWEILGPALTAGPDWWDSEAIWAPDVVWHPVYQSWMMFYTGVDSLKVQRSCLAHGGDLNTWIKNPFNPQFEPDSLVYYWSPTQEWSSFRDPFVYYSDLQWHMLSTAGLRLGGYPGYERAIIHLSLSDNLFTWEDGGVFWEHNGVEPWHELESCQYLQRGPWHHLFFAEIGTPGTSHLVSDSLGGWDHADWSLLERGGAPEVDQFDPGIDIFSRYALTLDPPSGNLNYVVRFDTLHFNDGGLTPEIHKPPPLDRAWESYEGNATLAQPTFGDNPVARGEESCGLVGNGWFGSQEYYQGPLSGRGSPGTKLGDIATGMLTSPVFTITGDYMELLVGGGYYPETCYVALVNAVNDSILLKETGDGSETMTLRHWSLRNYQGVQVRIVIVDQEEGAFGHINVDEIVEQNEVVSGATRPIVATLLHHEACPNPCNPGTEIRFTLQQTGSVEVAVYDLRGRAVWRTDAGEREAGGHALAWTGHDREGRPVPAGTYLYSIRLDDRVAGRGKISVVK